MKLVEFLTKVVSDQGTTERLCADPEATIRQAELSRQAMRAIRSGNPMHVAYVICVAEAPEIKKFDPID